MPCSSCGARQHDPPGGPSDWRRGVTRGVHVLVCPACRALPGWDAAFDCCPACGSRRLSKALGAVRCSECGAVVDPPQAPAKPADGAPGDLPTADEIDAAVARILRPNGTGP